MAAIFLWIVIGGHGSLTRFKSPNETRSRVPSIPIFRILLLPMSEFKRWTMNEPGPPHEWWTPS
jgi:hypothetical protein